MSEADAATMMRYDAMKKSAAVAYILWWFLGMFGGHRFYLGRPGSAAAILCITLVSFLLLIIIIGAFTLLISVVWWIVDAFLIPGMVRDHNLRLANRMAPA